MPKSITRTIPVIRFSELDVGERYRYATAISAGLNEVRVKDSETHYRAVTHCSQFGEVLSDSFEVSDVNADVTAASDNEIEVFAAKHIDDIRNCELMPVNVKSIKPKGMKR